MNKEEKEKLRKIALDLTESMPKIISQLLDFAAIEYRTPEEEKQYQELLKLVTESIPVITLLKDFFGHEVYSASVAWYYSLKEKAGNGNSKAQEIVDELAPLYQHSLLDQLDNN